MPYDNRDSMMSEISMTLLTFEKIDGLTVARIHHMFVAPECRRQGVAADMLDHLDDTSWWCEVPPGLLPFFRKAGCSVFWEGRSAGCGHGQLGPHAGQELC